MIRINRMEVDEHYEVFAERSQRIHNYRLCEPTHDATDTL
jgi:hypothetical protein